MSKIIDICPRCNTKKESFTVTDIDGKELNLSLCPDCGDLTLLGQSDSGDDFGIKYIKEINQNEINKHMEKFKGTNVTVEEDSLSLIITIKDTEENPMLEIKLSPTKNKLGSFIELKNIEQKTCKKYKTTLSIHNLLLNDIDVFQALESIDNYESLIDWDKERAKKELSLYYDLTYNIARIAISLSEDEELDYPLAYALNELRNNFADEKNIYLSKLSDCKNYLEWEDILNDDFEINSGALDTGDYENLVSVFGSNTFQDESYNEDLWPYYFGANFTKEAIELFAAFTIIFLTAEELNKNLDDDDEDEE